jgi:hypothetical protein
MNIGYNDIFYYSCLLLSAISGLYCIKKVDTAFRWLAMLIVLTFLSELIAKYISYGLNKQNNIIYHIFTPIEYTFYILIFTQFLHNKKRQKLFWFSALGLFLLEIGNTIFFQKLNEAPTNVIMVECVLLVFLSLLLFLKIRESPSQGNLLREGVFWFNSAVLCYYAFSTLHWGFHNMEVYNMENPPLILYHLNKILSGFLYLTFSMAILLNAMARSSISKTI